MILKVYTIFDRIKEESFPPFNCKNDGVAIREFQGIPENKRQDFRLFLLGTYDYEKMTYDLFSAPVEVEFQQEQ
ncbi:MAG: phage ORF5 protein [Brevinema sp.]